MQDVPIAMLGFALAAAAVLGACVGSFVGCAVARRQTGESVLVGRSHCPYCQTVLGPLELIPVFSYLVQGGRCRHCQERLPLRYLAVEVAGAIAFCAIVLRYGVSLEALQMVLFASILLYCTLVDLDSRTIPNLALVAAICVRLAYIVAAWLLKGADIAVLAGNSLVGGVAIGGGILAIVLIADVLFGRESMGGGDIKLFFVAGLYFGWQQGLFLVVVACIAGIAFAFAQGLLQPEHAKGEVPLRHRQIPFGPAIALACVVTMLVGEGFVQWYGGLL